MRTVFPLLFSVLVAPVVAPVVWSWRMLAVRYERPARWWHRVGLGLYFFPDGAKPGTFGFFGRWVLGTPLGWFTICHGFRVVADPDRLCDSWSVKVCWDEGHVACRWGARSRFVRLPWSLRYLSDELLVRGGRWAKKITEGKYAGAYQFPEDLCAPGQAPPAPYRSPPVLVNYTTRHGQAQSVIATVLGIRRIRVCWAGLPFVRYAFTVMDVQFSGTLGDGTRGVVAPYKLGADPVGELYRLMEKAAREHRWG